MAVSAARSFPVGIAGVLCVARHEWRQLVFSASTYVLQAGFLLVLATTIFVIGGFFDSDFASLDLMWTFLPWVAVVVVPAFAMRSLAVEVGSQEDEILASMPLSTSEIVLGKWLAGSALLLITLAFTAPIPFTLGYLGSPDWGAMEGGYLGAALLLSTFYAVGLFASALMGERTSAYVLAIALLFVLMLTGFDQAMRSINAPASLLNALLLFSPKANLARLATGNLELTSVFNFAVLAALALWGAVEALRARRCAPIPFWEKCSFALQAGLACIAGTILMVGVSRFDAAIDVTQDSQHTLSAATITAARSLKNQTSVQLFWSEHETSVPARIRDYAHRIERLFQAIERRSNGRLVVIQHDTAPDTEAEWTAMARGIKRVPLSSGDHFFLGAVISDGSRTRTFDYFDIERAPLLEYDMALALTKIGQARIAKVGLLSPLLTPSSINEPREGLSFVAELKRSADVAIVPFFDEQLPADLDALIVLGGGGLRPAMLYAIDQFVMSGKGLIVCLDSRNRFNPSSDAMVPRVTGRLETIADVLNAYGLKFEPVVTGDASLAAPIVSDDQRAATYPYWLRVKRPQMSAQHPVTANLHELLLVEPGYWTHPPSSGVVDLVTTTGQSGIVLPDVLKALSPSVATSQFKSDGIVRTLAAFIPGPLKSAFPEPSSGSPPYIARRDGRAAVFAIADLDWLFDPASIEGAGTPAARPLNDNHAMLVNMVEFSSNDVMLAQIRSRGPQDRRFTRVESIVKAEQARFESEERQASATIGKIEHTIGEILKATNAKSLAELPSNIRAEIEKLELGLIPVRRRLRDIRLSVRENIQTLGRGLTLVNLAAGPVLVCAFALVVFSKRRRPAL